MNTRLKKWVVRPFLILLIVILAAGGVGFVVLTTQQERLVSIAIKEFNKQFKGELTVEGSRIALFENFPYVSVALKHGAFFPTKDRKSPPQFVFEKLYAGFSIQDIWNQQYNLKVLVLKGGTLNLTRDESGEITILEPAATTDAQTKSAPTAADSVSVAIDLKKIVLRDLEVNYQDMATGMMVSTNIDKVLSSVRMDGNALAIGLQGDMKISVKPTPDSVLFEEKPLRLDLVADYNMKSELFKISHCKLQLQEATFAINGSADVSDSTKVDFRIKGENEDFNLLTAFLPAGVKQQLAPFSYDGRLLFDATIAGTIAENSMPHIQVTFGCEDAYFLNTDANKKVDQLGFKGYYTNGAANSLKTSEVHIINVSARPEKGIFKGHFVVRDFEEPKAIIQLKSELELKFLGDFFGIQGLKQLTGTIKLDMDFKELNDIVLPEESLNKLKEGIQSRLEVSDLTFQIPGYPHPVRDVNIVAEMRNGRITLDSARLKIGHSDLELRGSISDVRAFLRERHKPMKLALNAKSNQILFADLLSYDSVLARKWNEEVRGFNVGLSFETTAHDLLNPSPLPRGTFEMKNLRGTFKNYNHTVKQLSATVVVNDTLLRLKELVGMVDSSDFNFKGRVTNYNLWFDDVKKGWTQIAFDFQSKRFALRDVFAREVRQYLPPGYRREELSNAWLRTKIDLRYDTNFKFAKGRIANVTGTLKRHKLKLTEISGGFKYGSKILALDTLRGKVGNSDFDVSLKYYFTGVDRYEKKVANSLTFKSRFMDADEMSQYDLAPKQERPRRTSKNGVVQVAKVEDSHHAQAFNIFMIPFSDFNAEINIGKLKYNRLWLKDINAKLAMRKDQTLSVDTLALKIADGEVRMKGKFNGSNAEKIYFRSRIAVDQVDLGKMLIKLDHLGQDVVVNKNVKGKISGVIRSYVQVHPDLMPIMSNTKAEMNLSIYNGSLVDFAPMQAMASYFKDKNLRLIRFDTLQNTLTFTNGVLEIPAMDINSSLGYIQMSGRQALDLNMEYYIRVPMKVVTKVGFSSLFNKKQEEVDLAQVDEIEYVDKDRRMAFMNLKVTGTPDNFRVGLGKKK